MPFSADISPQERLVITRKAIVRHMNRHHPEIEELVGGNIPADSGEARPSLHGRLAQAKYAARIWWKRHPASAVAELASPFLRDYARAHPYKLLGISAFAGAIFVAIRPWRMMSLSALLIAAVKSAGLTNTLLTMLSSVSRHAENTETQPTK